MADRPLPSSAPLDHAGTLWRPSPSADSMIRRNGWSARFITGLGQTLISGNLAAARTALIRDAPEVGLWGIAPNALAVIRIARDRALVITETPIAVDAGWRPAGFAATPADGVYAVVEIDGPAARTIAEQGTSADLDAGSPSAATLFAGVQSFLYRTAETRLRIHVEAGYAAYLWQWLETLPD